MLFGVILGDGDLIGGGLGDARGLPHRAALDPILQLLLSVVRTGDALIRIELAVSVRAD